MCRASTGEEIVTVMGRVFQKSKHKREHRSYFTTQKIDGGVFKGSETLGIF
jgi:hypothetical protein